MAGLQDYINHWLAAMAAAKTGQAPDQSPPPPAPTAPQDLPPVLARPGLPASAYHGRDIELPYQPPAHLAPLYQAKLAEYLHMGYEPRMAQTLAIHFIQPPTP